MAQRLTILSYAGDFREAALRLAAGGPETYRGQRYTDAYLNGLAGRMAALTYITGQTDARYDERLPSGVRAIGAGYRQGFDHAEMVRMVAASAPDLLILRTPSRPVMRWARRNKVRAMLLIADSFAGSSLKSRLTRMMMAYILRADCFDVIANHGYRAAEQLVSFGVPAARTIAWDYPAFDSPDTRPAKLAPGAPFRLFYAGMLIPSKGVLDLVQAVAHLRGRGIDARLALAGRGEDARVAGEVARLGLSDRVTLLGGIPNSAMIETMAASDAVVVASHHAYPEGMPLSIYEALCSRTPLIVSDHPMFLDNVVHEESALVYPAGNVDALAGAVARLAGDAALYALLSANGADAWRRLQIPVKWHALIDAWIADGPDERAWISANAEAVRARGTGM